MDEVDAVAAELVRQRADLEAEKKRREQRGEDLSGVLSKLAELRHRIQTLKDGSH